MQLRQRSMASARCLLLVLLVGVLGVVSAATKGIWQPPPGSSAWQWQLSSNNNPYTVDTSYNVQMYDVDMFELSSSDMATLKNAGRVVICYVDVGSWESDRPDSSEFPAIVKANKMQGWPEYWFDISQIDPTGANPTILQKLLTARIALAASKGCHGIEPDNVDAYSNSVDTVTGIDSNGNPIFGSPITSDQQLAFNKWVANTVHSYNMSVALKNCVGLVDQLSDYFDWALNEQCNQYQECDSYDNFIASGKSVFNCEYDEYTSSTSQFCPEDDAASIDGILKNLDLNPTPYTPCRTNYQNGPICGDYLCVVGETYQSCPSDCNPGDNENVNDSDLNRNTDMSGNSKASSGAVSRGVIAGAVVGSLAGAVLLVAFVYYVKRGRFFQRGGERYVEILNNRIEQL